ncbi:MAG: cytochrome P450, partial [Myxococcales bacterium]|nr:cytochrome P450 [Myxococcales bacterium]
MEDEALSLDDLVADPDTSIRRMHERGCPFAKTELSVIAMNHEAVRSVVRDAPTRPAFSQVLASWGITSGPFYEWMSRSPLDMEGDNHRAWRKLMARTFTPSSVEKLRPSLRAEASDMAAALTERCEFISDFARVLPAIGLCELIGVPQDDRSVFGGWADTIGFGFNAALAPSHIAEIDAAIVALFQYVDALIARRRQNLGQDLVSRLIREADGNGVLDANLLAGSVAGLVFAGHETTKNQLGWMMVVLSKHAAEWDRVAVEPERATAVVEELLRYRGTASMLGRVAMEDFELLGKSFEAGTPIMCSLWGANWDRREFARPYDFDVDANAAGSHMAFGQGAHHCLGAALARLELQEALKALAARFACPEVGHGATFLPPIGINGPARLPLRLSTRKPQNGSQK